MNVIARQRQVARPLKILVPLIQEELVAGNEAGLENYRRAGVMLLEAKEQVSRGSWTGWLTKNFELSQKTAQRYMRLSRMADDGYPKNDGAVASLEAALGERPRRERHAKWQNLHAATDKVDVKQLIDEQHRARDAEIKLHREIAMKLIDLGYRALATRLHPDRGGSRGAMTRLNTVRDELKSIAATRRFV